MLHALRLALRRLLARPGYTVLSITVLGLGLGAMLFLLGCVNGIILEPLPFPDAQRLVAIGEQRDSDRLGDLDAPDFLRLRAELRGIDAFGVYNEQTVNISRGSGVLPKRYDGTALSLDAWRLLGVTPLLGRGFSAEDDAPGAPLTLLLSEQVWRSDFAADPDVIGRVVNSNGESATVIGVLPAGFAFPNIADVWTPRRLVASDDWGGNAIARLAPGVSIDQASAELAALAQRLGDQLQVQHEDGQLALQPFAYQMVHRTTRRFVWIMFAAGLAVLLLACANVANLQLAQTLTRRRELAVRAALGAGRRRLLRDLLAESLLLSSAATVIGLAAAEIGGRWLLGVFTANEEAPAYYIKLGVDGRMIGFAVLAALLTTLLAGLLPALRAARADVQEALRDGDKGSGGGFAKVARGLVVAEVALTVVLLIGAGMFIRALDGLLAYDFGTRADPTTVMTARAGLFEQQFPTDASRDAFFEHVVERLRADPRVVAAGVGDSLPGTMSGGMEAITALGSEKPVDGYPHALVARVDPGFADTYQLELQDGRFFDRRDGADSDRVAVVDRKLAQTLWPGRDPLGQTLVVDPLQGEQASRLRVVGVVADMQLEDADDPRQPTFFVPFAQAPTRFATLAVRAAPGTPAASLAPLIAETVRDANADTPVYWLRTQQRAIEMGRIGPVILTQIFGAVGVLALLLSAVGLYGVLAFAVEQRSREIGIRRAVGAGTAGIVRAVGTRMAWQVGLGLAIGIGLGLPWSSLLENPLLQTRAHDGLVFTAVLAMIVAVSLVASLAPLRRALRVDPIIALRQD